MGGAGGARDNGRCRSSAAAPQTPRAPGAAGRAPNSSAAPLAGRPFAGRPFAGRPAGGEGRGRRSVV